jgi:hypothetical protein
LKINTTYPTCATPLDIEEAEILISFQCAATFLPVTNIPFYACKQRIQ